MSEEPKDPVGSGDGEEAKATAQVDAETKAARAEARAARAAARAAKKVEEEGETAAELPESSGAEVEAKPAEVDEVKAARAAARAARDAARAAKKAEAEAEAEADTPKEPSPNQPRLDHIVQLIRDNVSEQAVEEAYVNEVDNHLPYIYIKPEYWLASAALCKDHDDLNLSYLRNLSGIDQESHLEVAYHLLSLTTKHEYCIKVKTSREEPSIPSVSSIWATADWNEREVFDLFGIDFSGHPNMTRIMMPDDWEGHPLRKDYEPLDPEV